MGILNHFDVENSGSVEDLHKVIEALRVSIRQFELGVLVDKNPQFAFGQRTALGDPNFLPGLYELERKWLSKESTKQHADMIDSHRTFPSEYYKSPKCVPR